MVKSSKVLSRCKAICVVNQKGYLSSLEIPIIKDFILAQQGVNYLVKLFWFQDAARIETCCTLDNSQTNERLVVKRTEADVSISRYPIGSNEEWLKEMTGWGSNILNNLYSEYRNINIFINS
jgi:hypothetical protein